MTLKYKDELVRSMDFLAEDPRTIFVGQSVAYSGNAIYNTLVNVPLGKKLETPVFEDVQMGLSIGLDQCLKMLMLFFSKNQKRFIRLTSML